MTHVPKREPTFGLALLLALLTMVSPFAVDTFFPSFREIQGEFGLDSLQIQQTLTVYLFFFGLASLVHGPMSDAYGRRRVVLVGTALFVVASLGCALAPTFGWLLVFRAMQGMTGGVGMIVARAVVRDLYEGPQAQRLMAAMGMIFGVAPAIAPVIGGWIHVAFGWRAVFVFLMIFALALWVVSWWRLPETHPPERRLAMQLKSVLALCFGIARHGEFLLLTTSLALLFAGAIAYIGAAPAIVLDRWQLTETHFAMLFLPVIGGFVGGAFISGRLAGRVTPRRQVLLGYGVSLLGAAISALAQWRLAPVPLLAQQGLLFLYAIGVQIVQPVVTLRVLDLFPDTRGAASSMQTFLQVMMMTVVMGVIVPVLQQELLWLALWAVGSSVVSFLLWRSGSRSG